MATAFPLAVNPASVAPSLEDVKRKHGLRSHLDGSSRPGTDSAYHVENLLPQRQLAILLGNSGVGKSPALYQLGICAAAGVPYLGEATTPSDVLYLDFENAAADGLLMAERVSRFLGLGTVPENFIRWHVDDCAARFGQPGHTIEDIIRDWSKATSDRPKLVMIDPLRRWLSQVENARFADQEVQKAHKLMRETGVAVAGVHHLRRVTSETSRSIPRLEVDPRTWVTEMSRGAQALINSSDVRLGFDYASTKFAKERDALVLAGFRRVRGKIGPVFIERVISEEDGEPIGYRRLAAVELLAEPSHIEAFRNFPDRFTFKDAALIFGKSDSATDNLLKKCLSLKLLAKEGREYVKVKP
jgi:hypothetical protein